jgi:hypothetical protein
MEKKIATKMRNGREEMKPLVAERESHSHTLMAYISGPAEVVMTQLPLT